MSGSPASRRSERHHGPPRARSTRPSSRRRGHDVLPGAFRGDRRGLGSMPTGPATTGTRPRLAARWTRTPRWGARFSASAELIPAYSPEAGPSASAPCRSACPRNSGSPASPRSMRPTASSRRSICPNTTPASRPGRGRRLGLRLLRRRARRYPLHPRGAHRLDDNTVRYTAPAPRRSPPTSRPRSGCTSIPTARSPSGPRYLARYQTASPSTPQPGRPRDASRDRPCQPPRLTTSPAQQHQQKRSTHMVHKPVILFSTAPNSRYTPQLWCSAFFL